MNIILNLYAAVVMGSIVDYVIVKNANVSSLGYRSSETPRPSGVYVVVVAFYPFVC